MARHMSKRKKHKKKKEKQIMSHLSMWNARCNHYVHLIAEAKTNDLQHMESVAIGPAYGMARYSSDLYDVHITGLAKEVFTNQTHLPLEFKSLHESADGYFRDNTDKLIALDIQDFQTPDLSSDFWLDLFDLLKGKRVVSTCLGSHGRSGMIAAILIGLDMNIPASEAMAWVRSFHCGSCIESEEQEQYVTSILNDALGFNEPIPVWAKPVAKIIEASTAIASVSTSDRPPLLNGYFEGHFNTEHYDKIADSLVKKHQSNN